MALALATQAVPAQEEVYSGPQAGEVLPPCPVRGVYDDLAGKDIDFVEQAGERPLLLIFMHDLTRPSAGLTRTLTDWAATRREAGAHCAIVWLSDDRTEAEQYLRRARGSLNLSVPVGISVDGIEGPGAYGLNRNVTLTVLVARDRRVTDNFALVQPGDTDAPRILAAFAKHAGGTPPTLEEIGERRRPMDERVVRAVRELVSPDLTSEEVEQRIRRIENGLAARPALARQLGDVALRTTRRQDFGELGTPAARAAIEGWARRYATMRSERMSPDDAANHPRWRELLAPVIRKDASPEQVARAVAAVEEFVREDTALQAALGAKARAVVSGKIFEEGGYGTEPAREQLRRWAERYGKERVREF